MYRLTWLLGFFLFFFFFFQLLYYYIICTIIFLLFLGIVNLVFSYEYVSIDGLVHVVMRLNSYGFT